MITEQELEELINTSLESEPMHKHAEARRVWLCDVRNNTVCRKTGCIMNGGPCLCTAERKYAYLDEKGHPIEVSRTLMDWAAKVANI